MPVKTYQAMFDDGANLAAIVICVADLSATIFPPLRHIKHAHGNIS